MRTLPSDGRDRPGAGGTVAGMIRRLAVTALLTCVLSACSAGTKPQTSPSAAGTDMRAALSAGVRFAQCARSHGHPNLPDPVVTDGRLSFPGSDDSIKQELDQVMQIPECKTLADQLPDVGGQRHAPSAQEMQQLLAFAHCLREHGIPEWPDPKADGTFPIVGTPLEAEGKSQRWLTASDACKQYWDRGIDAS